MDHIRRRNLNRELLNLNMEEAKRREAALRAKPNGWKQELEKKIPPKAYDGLVSAFTQGFSLVFRKGTKLLELTYDKENLKEQHSRRNDAARQGAKGVLKQMRSSVRKSNERNLAATTAEGVALGLFGVGLPDIVLFLSTLLKGIYETALQYGFAYESREEQYRILVMMEAALSSGVDWKVADKRVEKLMTEAAEPVSEEDMARQIRRTAQAFAVDMLLLKFIQGMPVVGLIGGAANPVYYQKVMGYVQLKYRKYYLKKQLEEAAQ